jgi:transcriptional regulator with XRE-family HTH domain
MSGARPPASSLGAIIRRQRELAALPMRQLAATVGISNPYLSQIERGLRAPSEAVLNAIADSLETTADALYSEAGFVAVPHPTAEPEADGMLRAIEQARELTAGQRRALAEVYRSFLDANAVRRHRAATADHLDGVDDDELDEEDLDDLDGAGSSGIP